MNEDLENEIASMNAIYGDETISTDTAQIYVLQIPNQDTSLRLEFPFEYPLQPPLITGTNSVGDHAPKGYGSWLLDIARETLHRVYRQGEVCLFDLLQELESTLATQQRLGHEVDSEISSQQQQQQQHQQQQGTVNEHAHDDEVALQNETNLQADPKSALPPPHHSSQPLSPTSNSADNISHHAGLLDSLDPATTPQWTVSEPLTVQKSVFLARACVVASPSHAKACIAHLVATDKRVAKATHNMTAYRIRQHSGESAPGTGAASAGAGSATSSKHQHHEASARPSEITYQDCDDDGESAAGGRLLGLMQLMDVWDVLVVVSRWYGGVKLGPERFRCIGNVAREVLVKGGWEKVEKGRKGNR